MEVTWPDRERERVDFRLKALRFGIENGLRDEEIAKALCEETRRKGHRLAAIKEKLGKGYSLIESLRVQRGLIPQGALFLLTFIFRFPLIEALRDTSRNVFPRDIHSMLKAGEIMGNLPTIISHAEKNIEQDRMIYTKTNMQMLYPIYLIFVPGVIISSVLVFIYPEFYHMFSDMGIADDFWYFSYYHYSTFLVWCLLGILFVSYLIFRQCLSVRKSYLAFMQVLSSALTLDVEEDAAIAMAAASSNSRIVKLRCRKARRFLGSGYTIEESISKAFPRGRELSWFFKQSRCSNAEDVFEIWCGILKDKLERKADVYAQGFSTGIVLFVGACAFLVALSIFMPLIHLTNALM